MILGYVGQLIIALTIIGAALMLLVTIETIIDYFGRKREVERVNNRINDIAVQKMRESPDE